MTHLRVFFPPMGASVTGRPESALRSSGAGLKAVRLKNPFVLLSTDAIVPSQRCPVCLLFIRGLILPAGPVGFGSAVWGGLTPQAIVKTAQNRWSPEDASRPKLHFELYLLFSFLYISSS